MAEGGKEESRIREYNSTTPQHHDVRGAGKGNRKD
jgi:hypothetical protein